MTPLSPARRAAEEFAGVVDGTHGELSERYADLLTCVEIMRAQEPPAPRPEFVADLRTRLMDAADTLLLPADDRAPATVIAFPDAARQRRQRRVSIAAAAFVVIGGTAGVAAAAENALPGDPLYPLKRGIESAQVSFNSSDSGKGQDLLRQASTRLDEVDGLIADDRSAGQIKSTLSSFQSAATDGADLIFVSYQRSGDPQDISRLRTMLGSQLTLLDRLSGDAPAGTGTSFTNARNLIADLDQQAKVLCGDCGPDQSLGLGTAPLSSSTPSLESLLVHPAQQAQAAAPDDASKLAAAAGDIAKNTPKTAPTQPATPSGTTPSVPLPSGGTATPPVKGTVSGVTNGVTGLLDQVDKATGGTTKPLTDTLTTTINSLLGLVP